MRQGGGKKCLGLCPLARLDLHLLRSVVAFCRSTEDERSLGHLASHHLLHTTKFEPIEAEPLSSIPAFEPRACSYEESRNRTFATDKQAEDLGEVNRGGKIQYNNKLSTTVGELL
jgi:hypothetical protein